MNTYEREFLTLIRTSKDPAALIDVALQAITACLQQPSPSGSPSPADLVTTCGTDP